MKQTKTCSYPAPSVNSPLGGAIIPSEVEFDHFVPADRFLGTSGDTSPAPLIWYELDSEFVGQVIYFDPDEITTASAFDAVRWPEIRPILSPDADCSILFFTDNADEQNDISFTLGYTGGTYPGGMVDNMPTEGTKTVTPPGQWHCGRLNFTIGTGGDINTPFQNEIINWFVRRNADDHPGNVYMIGLLVYFERSLA